MDPGSAAHRAAKSAALRRIRETLRLPGRRSVVSLPPQFAHQRPRRMTEQFLDRTRVELIDAVEVPGVDAAGHEQTIDSEAVRAGQVRPYRISDRQNAAELRRAAAALGGECEGALVDRPVRLAVEDHFATKFTIELGDGARAVD